jgi:Ca2+-binding EF-hand superfamily protein
MTKFKAVFLLIFGKLNKSVTVEEAHKFIDELDRNKDGKLSIADVILLLIEKAK